MYEHLPNIGHHGLVENLGSADLMGAGMKTVYEDIGLRVLF
jgi:hypothetical protein